MSRTLQPILYLHRLGDAFRLATSQNEIIIQRKLLTSNVKYAS